MIESAAALANVAEIAAVPGVDIVLIGTNDLCADFGVPGNHGHAKIVAAYDTLVAACRAAGKFSGAAGVPDEALMRRFIAAGARVVLAGADFPILLSAAAARCARLREAAPLGNTTPSTKAAPQPYPYSPVRTEWLTGLREDIFEPDLPIIDAHHHIWDRPGEQYLLDDFAADIASGHRIVGSVFMQCGFGYASDGPPERRPVGETRRMVELLAQREAGTGRPAGICQGLVGYVDLRLGDRAVAVLEAHLEAGKGRFKGIRQSSASDGAILSTMTTTPPPGLLADAGFRRGYRCLSALGLTYGAWMYHPQIHELIDLVTALPDVRVVLNHLGGPIGIGPYRGKQRGVFERWKAVMIRLAERPNVFIKLGGMARPVVGCEFGAAPLPPSSSEMVTAWRPYIETCIEAFGPDRAMFESNFPVDKGECSFHVLWNAYKQMTSGATRREREELVAGSARDFYRLDVKS